MEEYEIEMALNLTATNRIKADAVRFIQNQNILKLSNAHKSLNAGFSAKKFNKFVELCKTFIDAENELEKLGQ